jgi:hypothetical protein
MPRLICHVSGGDWNDAGFEILEIPDTMDLEQLKNSFKKWRKNHKLGETFYTFATWAEKHGAIQPTQIIEYINDEDL